MSPTQEKLFHSEASVEPEEEPAKKVAPTEPPKMPAPKAPSGSFGSHVMMMGGCLLVAVVVGLAQECDIFNGGSLQKTMGELFEEHVVLPPKAKKDVCTIQFCQS
jgi:hypothetical protein